jgi:hypothetical protein
VAATTVAAFLVNLSGQGKPAGCTGKPVVSPIQPAIQNHPTAYAGANDDKDHVLKATPCTLPPFAQHSSVTIIFKVNWKFKSSFQRLAQLHVSEAGQVWPPDHQVAARFQHGRDTNSDGDYRIIRFNTQIVQETDELINHGWRASVSRNFAAPANDTALARNPCAGDFGSPNVNRQHGFCPL